MSIPSEPSLEALQAWLHTFIVEPGTNREALLAAESKSGLAVGSADSLIRASATLTPVERLEIYRNMYLLRMEEALEIDFPAVQARVGAQTFSRLVGEYVTAYPSHSYTLDHLGSHFPEFLRTCRLDEPAEIVSELASLEWAMCVVSTAHDSSVLNLADIDPERVLELRFHSVPALRTLTFRHNTNALYREWSLDEKWPQVESQLTHLVIWRHDLETWRLDLKAAEFQFLELLRTGHPLGEALDMVLESHSISEEDCFERFQEWLHEGMFSDWS